MYTDSISLQLKVSISLQVTCFCFSLATWEPHSWLGSQFLHSQVQDVRCGWDSYQPPQNLCFILIVSCIVGRQFLIRLGGIEKTGQILLHMKIQCRIAILQMQIAKLTCFCTILVHRMVFSIQYNSWFWILHQGILRYSDVRYDT